MGELGLESSLSRSKVYFFPQPSPGAASSDGERALIEPVLGAPSLVLFPLHFKDSLGPQLPWAGEVCKTHPRVWKGPH